jgi:hypothetical protein
LKLFRIPRFLPRIEIGEDISMPYITQDRREALMTGAGNANTPGELNFCFTVFMIEAHKRNTYAGVGEALDKITRRYIADKGLTYSNINDVIGAFAGAAMEYKRRDPRAHFPPLFLEAAMHGFYAEYAAPYEDVKIIANGDLPYEF